MVSFVKLCFKSSPLPNKMSATNKTTDAAGLAGALKCKEQHISLQPPSDVSVQRSEPGALQLTALFSDRQSPRPTRPWLLNFHPSSFCLFFFPSCVMIYEIAFK